MFIGRLCACLAVLLFQKGLLMNYLSLYAFVQIVGESLPLSSSGNVKVWTSIFTRLGFLSPIPISIPASFIFLLHIPALIILLLFFAHRWIPYIPWYSCNYKTTLKLAAKVILADSITSLFYLVLQIFNCHHTIPLWFGFLITAACLYSTKDCAPTQQDDHFTYQAATGLGIVQGIALLPGISRFASTFAYARWHGYKPADAVWYCFLVQIPLLIGASLASCCIQFYYQTSYLIPWSLLISASCIAYVVLKLVVKTIDHCTFWRFSWYALGLAASALYLGL